MGPCSCCKCTNCTCNERRQNTVVEAFEIIKAQKEGKTLECRSIRNNETWGPRADFNFNNPPNFAQYQYRIKEEPKVLYSCFRNGEYAQSFTNEDTAKGFCSAHSERKYYKMIQA
jgi:hypothetical protein